MPKTGSKLVADRRRLVGVRVEPETHLVFVMASAAYDMSLQDLLLPLLEKEAKRLRSVPEIAKMTKAAGRLRPS
jgi:hypothetical protein